MKAGILLLSIGLGLLSACTQNNGDDLAAPPKGNCAQDIKDMRSKFDDDLRSGSIDQPVLDRLIPELDQVQKVCNEGDERRATALLMQVVINEQLGSDDTYARKMNMNQDQK